MSDNENKNTNAVAVIGLGKLGLPLATVLSNRFKIIGVERDGAKVNQINNGVSPYREPGLQELLPAAVDSGNLHAIQRLSALIDIPPVIIVIVGSPTSKTGDIDHSHIVQALREVGSAIAGSPTFHTVVVASTVVPGFCDNAAKKYLEESSHKRMNEKFGLCYVPENVQLGNVIDGFRLPDYVVVGASCDRAAEQAVSVYSTDAYPVVTTSLINAEISKLVLNMFLTLKITFANEMATLCDRLLGADINAISDIIGLDRRVGRKFLTAGAPFGGFCFPRDISTMQSVARYARIGLPLVDAVAASNDAVFTRTMSLITAELLIAKNRRVAVLGLGFKAGVPYKDHSYGASIASALHSMGVTVRTYDPMTSDEFSAKKPENAIAGAGVVLVANDDPAFYNLPYAQQLVIDPWRCLDEREMKERGCSYVGFGLGQESVE